MNTVWVLTTDYAATEEQDMLPAGGLTFLRVYANRDDAITEALREVANCSNAGEEDEAEVEREDSSQSLTTWTITSHYEITTVKVQFEHVR